MKKLLFLGLFLISIPASALTLSEIRDEARLRVKDGGTSSPRFTDAEIDALSNEAQRDIINMTWMVQKSTDFVLVSGTTYYDVPEDLIEISRLTWKNRNLYEVTLVKLDSDFNNSPWLNSGGVPQYYYQDTANYGRIGIYPFPNSTAATGTVVMNYYARVADMSADSDEPFNGSDRYTSYHYLIIYYVCYRIHLLEGEVNQAAVYRQEYEARLEKARNTIGSRPAYIPGLSGTRSNP